MQLMVAFILLFLLLGSSIASAQDEFMISKVSVPKGNRESLVIGNGYVISTPNSYSPNIPAVLYWDSGKIDTLGSVEHADATHSTPTTDIVATCYGNWVCKYLVDRSTATITLIDSIALPGYRSKISGIGSGGKYLFMDSLFEFEPVSRTWVFSIQGRCLDIQTDPSGNEWALFAHNLFVRWNGANSWDWHFSAVAIQKPPYMTHVMHADDKGRVWVMRDTLKYYDVSAKAWKLGPSGLPDTTLPGIVSKFSSITQDDEGSLYLAGPSGVFKSQSSSMPFERLANDLTDSLSGMPHYGLATQGFPYREFIHNPLHSNSTLHLTTDVGVFTSSDRGQTWKHTPRTNAGEVSELIVDDKGVTVATNTGIYRKPVEGDWVKIFPLQGFMPMRMFAAPDLALIVLVGKADFDGKNAHTLVTLDTFRSFILDTVGNWRRNMTKIMIDKDHNIYSHDGFVAPYLATKKVLGDWTSANASSLGSFYDMYSSSQASYILSSGSMGQRVQVFTRDKSDTDWSLIYETVGNPASFSGIGQGDMKPVVIANEYRAVEWDGINEKELISPAEFHRLNAGLDKVVVSNNDGVWILGHVPDTAVLLYSADRVNWHELRNPRTPYRFIRAFGDSAMFVSNEGIYIVKFAGPKGKVTSQGYGECRVIPNPAKDQIRISGISAASPTASISFFEATGKLIRTITTDVLQGSAQIPLGGLAAGTYLINVQSGEKSFSSKFILEP